MATFSDDYHFRREEVTVIFQCYRLRERPANRLVRVAFTSMKCHVMNAR